MNRKTMTTMMFAATLLLVGPPAASASCMSDVAEAHRECLSGPRDRARTAECNASYRDDVAECARYEHGRMPHRPAPMPMHHEPPPPPPPRRH